MVAAPCTAHGYRVIDLGSDVPPNKFLETAAKESADILALSTLLTTTLPYHREVVQLLRDTGRRNRVYVLVGGGPVSPAWADEIGADGYGRDAAAAANLVKSLLGVA